MTVNPFAIYGDYAADYAEDWVIGSYEDYVDAAYIAAPRHFEHATAGFNLKRLPLYPDYELLFDQATEQATGGNLFGYAPYAQEMIMRLKWPRMCKADKLLLEALFSAVRGMADTFVYTNVITGPSQRVRFAEPSLPVMPEVAYETYDVSIGLRIDLNYPQMVASGTPNPAITGNRFVIGSVAIPFPAPLRPSTGYGVNRFQPFDRLSSGVPTIYEKSRIMQRPHTLAMILNSDQFISLQAFFFSFVHGQQKTFTWYDPSGAAHVVRLATNKITIRQVAYNRYAVELPLIEELFL